MLPLFAVVGVMVGKFPNAEVAVSAGGAVENEPEGVDACSVANRPEGGVAVPGPRRLQDSATTTAKARSKTRRFIPLL